MIIGYQFLEGAKLGSIYVGHFGQIQDGGLPESHTTITGQYQFEQLYD